MTSKEALKRLKQETAPATYMPDSYTFKDECIEVIKQDLEKLDQYKQLEKQLGINLELYVNTYLKGVYIKGMEPLWSGGQKNEILHYTVVGFTKECLEVRYRDSHDTHRLWYPLEDYGEIWALTLEELQND